MSGQATVGFVVSLEASLDEDEMKGTLAALARIRGVLEVTPLNVGLVEELAIEARVRAELGTRLYSALFPPRVSASFSCENGPEDAEERKRP